MRAFGLSPEAEEDVWSIWQHLAQEAGLSAASRVQSTIFDKIGLLARMPGLGHWRRDITDEPVKFFLVLLLSDRLQARHEAFAVVGILHGSRDLSQILHNRL